MKNIKNTVKKTSAYRFLSSLCIALGLVATDTQAGVGDGPRAYQIAPIGSQKLSFIPMHQNSSFNVDGSPSEPAARIKVDILAVQYTNVVQIGSQTAGLFALVPTGKVEGKLINTPKKGDNRGMGDAVIGAIVGLSGAPAMSPQEYGRFNPGLSFGLLGKLTLPTGEYDSDKLFNLGANRWAAQIGGVMTHYFGDSLIPGQVSSLEVIPSVTFYGDNDSPHNADKLEQKPLYALETHLTHDFSSRLWGSIDALYNIGGATTTDGVKSDTDTEKFALGFTLGTNLPHGFNLQLNYGKTLKVDSDGYHDHLVRLKIAKSY